MTLPNSDFCTRYLDMTDPPDTSSVRVDKNELLRFAAKVHSAFKLEGREGSLLRGFQPFSS